MIVPQFWAEGRVQHRAGRKRLTLRRFGWSDLSLDDAQAMADARAAEALGRHLAGERVHPRDHKVAYNGAEGLPIREQVLERHGAAVITRNLYGARCLNVPDVLFADVDFGAATSSAGMVLRALLVVVAAGATAYFVNWKAAVAAGFVVWLITAVLARAGAAANSKAQDAREVQARARLDAFLAAHPDWQVRLYRTPAGLRLLALHRLFDPREPAVKEFFDAIGADPLYARMCFNQRCFRARLDPKPWRIGMTQHLKPRPGVWPVKSEHLAGRARWVAEFERRASGFAACRYVEALGRGRVDVDADRVRQLHDELSGASSGRAIA